MNLGGYVSAERRVLGAGANVVAVPALEVAPAADRCAEGVP